MKEKKKWIIPLAIVGVLLIAGLAWWMIVVNNIAEEITIEAGSAPQASDYLIRDLGEPAEFVTDVSALDLTKPGTYEVQLRYRERLYDALLQVRDTVAPEGATQDLTVFATQKPVPEDFITELRDVTLVTVSYGTEPDMSADETQTLTLVLTDEGGNTTDLTAQLTVIHDMVPPVIEGVAELSCYPGDSVDYLKDITVTDDLDPDVTVAVDDSEVDLNTPGVYQLVYTAADACGNRCAKISSITVIDDTTPPQIYGAINRSVAVGSTISYRSGVAVSDDTDPSPKLSIDSSAVDLSKPGSYPLVYTCTDGAGNTTSKEITVTVHEKGDYFVEESEIYAKVDEALSKIVTEDMTVQEQVEAIYSWTRSNFRYSSYSDKRDWKQSGYQLLKKGYGDCFSFFGLSKLMFERLGIPNIDVRRMRTYVHYNDHFWNMVSVDGGETYYYYDSTPYPGEYTWFCLATDAELDAFSARHGSYFSRDRSILPTTPLERP